MRGGCRPTETNIMAVNMSTEGDRREVGRVQIVLFFTGITRHGRPTTPRAVSRALYIQVPEVASKKML
jgi:hypothetical protein